LPKCQTEPKTKRAGFNSGGKLRGRGRSITGGKPRIPRNILSRRHFPDTEIKRKRRKGREGGGKRQIRTLDGRGERMSAFISVGYDGFSFRS